jgi:hypothetical protein
MILFQSVIIATNVDKIRQIAKKKSKKSTKRRKKIPFFYQNACFFGGKAVYSPHKTTTRQKN